MYILLHPPEQTEQGSAHTEDTLPPPSPAWLPPAGQEGLTIACSTAGRRSAGTRRAAANHRLCSLRNQAPGLGMLAGQLQVYERFF